MSKVPRVLLLSAVAMSAQLLSFQSGRSQRARWNEPFPPFRIIGNIYYVGARGVSSFLIVTRAGDILLDGGLPETAPLVERHIKTLGFTVTDVKILLNSHAHYDHCGGLEELKRASGAELIASKADMQTLTTGHQLSYGPGQSDTRFPAAQVSRTVSDGETVALGNAMLMAHMTPGHTKGCTTWTMPVSERGKIYKVVFYCSTTVAGNQLVRNARYSRIVADYQRSFAVLRTLPCDIFLAPHPEFFDMEAKRKRQQAGQWDAFIDPGELTRFVNDSEQDFLRTLHEQQSKAARQSR